MTTVSFVPTFQVQSADKLRSSRSHKSSFSSDSCTVLEVEKCEGEAVVNNRKGKLIFFYEWSIVLKWVSDKDKDIEGKINIPNLSEENDLSEVDVSQFLQKQEIL